jgi:Xaa-Pro aminopeptidase
MSTENTDEILAALETPQRVERLRALLSERELPGLIITELANVRYLSGFTGSAAVMVVTAQRALLTTDGRYRTRAAEELAGAGTAGQVALEVAGAQGQRDAVRSLLLGEGVEQVGLEAEHVSWAASRRWRDLFNDGDGIRDVVPTSGVIEALREVKDAGELDRMAKAAHIADLALSSVMDLLASAQTSEVTEAEFALALDTAMRHGGSEDRAFETIVAAGENSAKPHHQPTDRPIRRGDPVVVDFGATYGGYRSDMTRTFCIGGEPTGELARVFSVVLDAQARGAALVGPGVGAKAVDDACRQTIDEAGWAERFEHGTGHGVGLDIHEAPTVSALGTAILSPGVVVTVEPGVYLPGVGGVRIEDTLVVTEEGSRVLTHFPKTISTASTAGFLATQKGAS